MTGKRLWDTAAAAHCPGFPDAAPEARQPHAKLPARKVLAVLCGLGQIQSGRVQLIHKADRSGLTSGKGYFLGIGTGTGVHCIDGGILVAQLLDVHSASGKSGDGDLTIGIGSVRAGNPCSTSGIGVDTELPACQVLIVLSGLGQVQPGRIASSSSR